MISYQMYSHGFELSEPILEIISEIDSRNMTHSWSNESWKDLLKLKDLILIVAKEEELIIGYALYLTQPADEFAHLIQIAVESEFRGKKIAKTLMDMSFKELKKQKISTIQLEVSVSNEIAIKLYQKMGLEISRRTAKFYSNGEDAYIMLKTNL